MLGVLGSAVARPSAPLEENSDETHPDVSEGVGVTSTYEVPTEDEADIVQLDEEYKKLLELQPPGIDSYVPFAEVQVPSVETVKPRKGGKKYNPEEKWINKNNQANESGVQTGRDGTHQYDWLDLIIENLFQGIVEESSQGAAPNNAGESRTLVLNKGEYIPN